MEGINIIRFDFEVSASGTIVKEDFELDNLVVRVHSVLLTSDREDLLYYRGSLALYINGTEVFPEGYESKLLQCGLNVEPDRRRKTVVREAGNGIVRVEYTDFNHPQTTFAPYVVHLYVEAEYQNVG